ncbi:MAG: Rossmann-like and DUF2520 domain-containing protein [Saprospiraceae bacterium]
MKRIVLIGAGRVARAVFSAFGDRIVGVYNRSLPAAQEMVARTVVSATDRLDRLPSDADLYLLAVADEAIQEMAEKLSHVLPATALLAHTSGATSTDALLPFARRGIWYPLQSFGSTAVGWSAIPIIIHATRPEDADRLAQLAAALGGPPPQRLDDAQRARLHVAAVFANNFTNHLYHLAYRLCTERGVDFGLLLPLIRETAGRLAAATDPAEFQTGPAVRNDGATIKRHLADLEDQHLRKMYELLTHGIERFGTDQ